jgi:hypothetical protein
MPWVRIDDSFPEHPKWGNSNAFEVQWFLYALCYCNRNLTDGFIPVGVADRLIRTDPRLPEEAKPFQVIRRLLAVGIIRETEKRGMSGYQIHDFLDYQPSKKQVEREREVTAKRQGRYRGQSRFGTADLG